MVSRPLLLDIEQDVERTLDVASESAIEPPWRVIIHNDDETPMDFVVYVLMTIFELSEANSLDVMLTAHFSGMAYVASFPRPEAQRRVGKAHFAAGLEGFPLQFTAEPE